MFCFSFVLLEFRTKKPYNVCRPPNEICGYPIPPWQGRIQDTEQKIVPQAKFFFDLKDSKRVKIND